MHVPHTHEQHAKAHKIPTFVILLLAKKENQDFTSLTTTTHSLAGAPTAPFWEIFVSVNLETNLNIYKIV